MLGNRVEVAAAVVMRDNGRFLLARRPVGKVYAGYWEFPGGKIESGESPLAALRRELHEELGIDVEEAYPWITRDYDYPHAAVRLRFLRVTGWHGEPHGREAQGLAWQSLSDISVSPLLPANVPVLRALSLPTTYGVTNASGDGIDESLRRVETAIKNGLRLIQIREKAFSQSKLREFSERVIAIARTHGARVLINSDVTLAADLGADGVHLTAAQIGTLPQRPPHRLVGASCHDAIELERALILGADFVVLGPVLPTASHPALQSMGWEQFATLIQDYPLPAYAIGGMLPKHMRQAWRAGAHGIAMMRAAWNYHSSA